MDKLNQWLTLLANLGVLAGIGFLAYEVRQNTDAIHSQTRATMFAGAQEELWKNMEYPDVTLNMQSGTVGLTDEEKVRLDAWLTASLRAREFAWIEYTNGNIDVEQWRAEQEVIKIILGTQRTRDWWNNVTSSTFHKDFVAVVRELTNDQPESEFVESILSIE